MGKLDGKVVLITGGNKGIGKGIARAMAGEGASLVLAGRDEAALARTAGELTSTGCDVLAVPTDVTEEEQVEALFVQALARFGRLDILVNNAGAFDGGPWTSCPPKRGTTSSPSTCADPSSAPGPPCGS